MPYAKVLPISSAKMLSGKLKYLTNTTHRNHRDKTIEAAVCHRTANAASFLAKTVATIRNMNARQRRGRKIRNLADEVIIRLPDWSNPTAAERARFFQDTVDAFCPDSEAIGVWHIDKYNGSADLHLIVANYLDVYPPKVRRSSAFNPIALVRAASDQITDAVNLRRREQSVVPIVTMKEVRKARLKERGLKTLAEQLAPLLPFPAADLPERIESLGYKVTRYNASRNSISVCLSEDKKAHRYFLDRLWQETVSLGVNRAAKILPPSVPKIPRPKPRPNANEIGFD